MAKKKGTEPVKEKDIMELELYEINELREIADLRAALNELEKAIQPFALQVAKRQRVWWQRVLENRKLEQGAIPYTTDCRRIYLNEQ